jgi:hypothetical protein
MPVTQAVYTIGTAATTVVAPTIDAANYVLKSLEPASVDESAKDGYIYLLSRSFTVPVGSSVNFSITTGSTGAQLDFYHIVSTIHNIYAELIEDATITTTGDPIPAYNLNRNFSDSHASVFRAATAITGGKTISAELVTADKAAGGDLSSEKIHTLEANTQYGFRFTNQGNQDTQVFFQLGFSEAYNGYNEIWLGSLDNSYVLRGGEEVRMYLFPDATITARAKRDGARLAVIRQD